MLQYIEEGSRWQTVDSFIATSALPSQQPLNWRDRATREVCRLLLAVIDNIVIPVNHYLALGLSMVIVFLEWTHVLAKGKRRLRLTDGGFYLLIVLIVIFLERGR